MGTIADKIKKLNDTKLAIKKAIENKGVTNVGDVFSQYPSKIMEITTGGGTEGGGGSEGGDTPCGDPFDFKGIGYTGIEQPIVNGIAYAKEIKRTWGNREFPHSMSGMFYLNKKLVFFPLVDCSMVTDMSNAFNGCSSLVTIPKIDTSNCTSFNGIFEDCVALSEVPNLDFSKGGTFQRAFYNCKSLRVIPRINCIPTAVDEIASGCDNLLKIEYIDMTNCGSMWYFMPNTVRYLNLNNLGKYQNLTSIDWGGFQELGIDGDGVTGCKQALIDTILINSFDRAKAEYAPCIFKFSSYTKALLSESDIAAITAKGFTIA